MYCVTNCSFFTVLHYEVQIKDEWMKVMNNGIVPKRFQCLESRRNRCHIIETEEVSKGGGETDAAFLLLRASSRGFCLETYITG